MPSWDDRYNGTANGLDQAKAIATDKRGNTYVTGKAAESGGGASDIVTIKYSPSGQRLWPVSGWDGAASGEDVGNAIAVDDEGNAYVTGYTTTANGDKDLIVLKLSTVDGDVLWQRQYNHATGTTDEGLAIALGQNGYVYVAGHTQITGDDGSADFLTLALDGADGSIVPGWPKTYDHLNQNHEERAVDIAVGDEEGHVWVTGFTRLPEVLGENTMGWVTLMYSPSELDPIWVSEVRPTNHGKTAQPYAMAVDVSGNSFVTGDQHNGFQIDYYTVSYDIKGQERWKHTHHVGGADIARALGLQVDVAGNAVAVYVTGQVGTAPNLNFGTLKYYAAPAGTQLVWNATYQGSGGANDVANDLAVAGNGNVYVTGFVTENGMMKYATLRYDIGGNQIGQAAIRPGNGPDIANAIAASCAGVVHVTGQSAGTLDDYLTLLYTQQVSVASPASYNLFRGTYVSGNLQSLLSSDNDRLVAGPGPVLSSAEAPVTIDITSQVSMAQPSELCLVLEAHASSVNIQQTVELWDYVAQQYRQVDQRDATTSDSTVYVTSRNFFGPYAPSRFIHPDSLEVKARIKYRQIGPVLGFPWSARVDYVAWRILP